MKQGYEIYQSRVTNLFLRLQWTTVTAVIYQWKKRGLVMNIPGSVQLTKILQELQQLIKEVTKEPTVEEHLKNCRPHCLSSDQCS